MVGCVQGGETKALALTGYSNRQMEKMGCWKGATFKEYIRDKLARYVSGMTKAMEQKFNYANIALGVFADVDDITQVTVRREYATLRVGCLAELEALSKQIGRRGYYSTCWSPSFSAINNDSNKIG